MADKDAKKDDAPAESRDEPKTHKVQIHGSTEPEDVVTVHATVNGERRVPRFHRQHLESLPDRAVRPAAVAREFVGPGPASPRPPPHPAVTPGRVRTRLS